MTRRQLRLATFWYTRQLDRWPFERPLAGPSTLPAGAAAGEAADGPASGPPLLQGAWDNGDARGGPLDKPVAA